LWTATLVTPKVFVSTTSRVRPSADKAASRLPSSLNAIAGRTVSIVSAETGPAETVPPVIPGSAIGLESWSFVERTYRT